MAMHDVSACLFAGQMTCYRLTGTLSSLAQSLTDCVLQPPVCRVRPPPFPLPLKRLIACLIGLTLADKVFVCVIETVDNERVCQSCVHVQMIST